MTIKKVDIASVIIPILTFLHLFFIGFEGGWQKSLSFPIFIMIVLILHVLENNRLVIRKNILIFFFLFICVKVYELTNPNIELVRIVDSLMVLYLLMLFSKFVDMKKFTMVIFVFAFLNSLILVCQIAGIPEFHIWNTLMSSELRSSYTFLTSNIAEVEGGNANMLRPPGIFYSQAINAAFCVGLLFFASQNKRTWPWILAVVSCLLCGAKLALLGTFIFILFFLFKSIQQRSYSFWIKFIIGVLLILIYYFGFPQVFNDRYSLITWVFSFLLRFGPYLSKFFNYDANLAIFADSRLGDTAEVGNLGSEVIISVVALLMLFLIFPTLKTKLLPFFKGYLPVVLVSFATPIAGSLVCLLMWQGIRK